MFVETMDDKSAVVFRHVLKKFDRFVSMFPQQECRDFFSSVFFDFIFNPQLNALSKHTKAGYIIGINSGFVDTISRYFFTILANPNVLPQLEQKGFENSVDDTLTGHGFDPFEAIVEQTLGNMQFRRYPVPKGIVKFRVAFGLSVMAVFYVVLHELGHIVDGHVDGMQRQYGCEALPEGEDDRQSLALPNAFYHGIEFIADGFATVCSIANELTSDEAIDGLAEGLEVAGGIPFDHTKFFFWSFAINSVLQLLSQRPSPLEASDMTHPHPQVRIVANEFTVTLLDVVNERSDYDPILTQYARGRKAVATVWRMLQLPGHEFDPYENKNNVRTVTNLLHQESLNMGKIEKMLSASEMTHLRRILTRGARVSSKYKGRYTESSSSGSSADS